MGFRSWDCGSCGTYRNRPAVYFSGELLLYPEPEYGTTPSKLSQIIIQKIYIYALRRYLSLSLRGIPLSSVIRQTFLLKIITQKQPRLKLNHQKAGSPPLLLLPLLFPSHSAHPLTPWNTIDIHLPSFLLHFSSPILQTPDDDGERDQEIKSRNTFPIIPGGKYSHVSYVRVYANCRLRRIWFGENDPKLKAPWEFELYSI